ncbi:TrmB family transcriptional regulator [Halosimplex sp. TS25]|uniref:TrmB family transcriptional regulator n=1 Tax=Halosimplex rarum TaxID=3396619 RepID=UPI0039E9DA90
MGGAGDRRKAVEAFQKAGLTEYEAGCFVALSRFGAGTAKGVAEISDLPRTRVYDLAERLQDRGLVEIREGNPREFRAVDPDLAVEKLRREHSEHLESAAGALRAVATPQRSDSTSGPWRIEGQQDVIEREQFVAARAETELFGFFTSVASFDDDCFRQVQYAIDRGVSVVLGASDEDLRVDLRERFPDATVWSPSLDWQTLETDGSQLSRLVMADRSVVLLASLRENGGTLEETAVWGEGDDSELVIFCRNLLGVHLDEVTDDGSPGLPL